MFRTDLPYPVASETGNSELASATRRLFKIVEEQLGDVDPATFTVFDMMKVPELHQIFATAFRLQAAVQDPKTLSRAIWGSIPAQQCWQQAAWRMNGRRVYDLAPALTADLLQTSLARLSGDEIPFPTTSFYLRVSDSARLGLNIWNVMSGEHRLDGFYVSVRDDVMNVLAAGFPHEGSVEGDDALCTYAIDLKHPDLEEQIEKIATNSADKLEENANRIHDWLRIIFGFCLYLTCDDFDVEKQRLGPTPALRDKARKLGGKPGKKLLEMATLPVHYLRVGFREKPNKELEAVAGADDEVKKLTKRFIVRGHFRRQAHGPGRTERKTIFVRSFWKGPPWGEIAASITKVRNPRGSDD